MSTEESMEFLECSKCGQSVEQILALGCNHNLCLDCASKNLVAANQGSGGAVTQNSLKCEICSVITVLDPASVEVLLEMGGALPQEDQDKQQQQNQDSQLQVQQQQQQDQLYTDRLDDVQNTQQQEQQQEQQYLQQQLEKQQNELLNNMQEQFQQEQQREQERQLQEQQLQQLQQQQQQLLQQQQQQLQQQQVLGNSNFQGSNQPSFIRQQQNPSASYMQSTDDNILFCFTCETPCFSVENYLNGLHKNHDVGNAIKRYDDLQNSVDDLKFKLKTRSELLLNDESRLTQKKRDIVETVSQAKNLIKQSFDEIIQIVEQKQQQLLESTEEIMEEKFLEIDRCLQKVQTQNQYLQAFDQELDKIYYKSERSQINDVSAFNFYAENKQKVLSNLKEMDTNFFTQVKQKLSCDFMLDMNSVYTHIDTIKGVKMEVMALRGLESVAPTQKEHEMYEQAIREKNERKYEKYGGQSFQQQGLGQEEKATISQENFQQKLLDVQKTLNQQKLQDFNNQKQVQDDHDYLNYVEQKQQIAELQSHQQSYISKSKQQEINENSAFNDTFQSFLNNTKQNQEDVQQQPLGSKVSNNSNQLKDLYGQPSKPVMQQLDDLRRQITEQPRNQKENKGESTVDRLNALRSRFQPSQ